MGTGGKAQKETNNMMAQDRSQATGFASGMDSTMGSRGNTSYGRDSDMYNQLYKGYSDYASGASGGGGGGGVYMPNYSSGDWGKVRGMYDKSMGASGGLEDARVASMDSDLSGFGTMGRLGASDEASATRLRGNGVYDEMAKTGGVSDAEAYGIRDRSTRNVQGIYDAGKDQIARRARASGGSSAATGAAISRMARQGGQQVGQTSLDAETGIAGMRREGRLAGAQGLSSTEQAIIGNQMSGMGSQFQGQKALAESIRSGQQYGTSGLADLAGRQDEANQRAASASASAGMNADASRRFGLGGLMDLRDQEIGQENTYSGRQLSNQGLLMDTNSNNVQGRIANNPRRSALQGFTDVLGAAGSVAGGVGGLMAGIPSGRRKAA